MRLEAVGKRYGLRQPWVVRGVTADLPAGRLIRVSGRNGSGKSTLLRVVAGVSLPSAGKVTGRPHTGYVPERFPGGLPFSGREYLLHLARQRGHQPQHGPDGQPPCGELAGNGLADRRGLPAGRDLGGIRDRGNSSRRLVRQLRLKIRMTAVSEVGRTSSCRSCTEKRGADIVNSRPASCPTHSVESGVMRLLCLALWSADGCRYGDR